MVSHLKNTKAHKENIPPRSYKPATPEAGLIGKLGSYEDRRKKLQDERKREYNEMLAGKNVRTRGVISPAAQEYVTTLPGLRDDSSAQRPQDRRTPPPRRRSPDRRTPDLSPPPSRSRRHRDYDDRAGKSRRMEDPFDDEDAIYERFMRERLREPPRRGWATPTYGEILDKKRNEEKAYRRGGYEDGLGSDSYTRTSRSDGQLGRYVDDEMNKFKQLDKEYETKKVRFRDDRSRGSSYEPSAFDPDSEFTQWLTQLRLKYGARLMSPPTLRTSRTQATPIAVVSDLDPHGYEDGNRNELDRIDRDLSHLRRDQPPPRRRNDAPPPAGNFAGSLGVGRDVSASTDMKRKAVYRKELESQMQQTKQNKRREKEEDLRVNATGLTGIFQEDSRVQPPTTRHPVPQDSFRDLYNTPSDDAYHYYGKMNPLEPAGAPEGLSIQDRLGSFRDDYTDRSQKPSRVTKVQDPKPDQAMAFPTDDERTRSKADAKKSYQQELKRQIEEDKRKKEKTKRDQDEYDRKLDDEVRNYNPYGKGGGGAPMRDVEGNVLADLRKMNLENTETLLSPGRKAPSVAYNPSVNFQSPRKSPPPASQRSIPEDQGHARGGNGIFGEPMGDAQKRQRERYQDDLKAQIEQKKRQAEEEKRKEQLEDERLLKKIEEDNAKMQEQFDKEQQKDRAKNEALEKQQEEIKKQQEEKRKETERRKRELDDERQMDLRREEEEKKRGRERQREQRNREEFRSDSPPIPTLRKGTSLGAVQEERRMASPPVPALRSKTDDAPHVGRDSPPIPAQRALSRQSRSHSADVLNQLAKLKQQLQNESKRVETDLRSEQKQPEVYDPRLYQRHNADLTPHLDIFDVSANRQPVQMSRIPDDSTDPSSMNEFKKLKKGSTSSRQQLHKLFPDTPTSGDALETQQRVLLQAQEDNLHSMKQGPYDRQMPDMTPKGLGLREQSSVNLLDSDSAFIDIPGNGFDSRRRNDSARSRRRRLETPTYNRAPSERSYDPRSNMGSVASLDPDRIDRRNEERLRKLKSLTGDEQSLADPDDILERFMAKQHHARPPSGHTLQDDSWLRPGTHNR